MSSSPFTDLTVPLTADERAAIDTLSQSWGMTPERVVKLAVSACGVFPIEGSQTCLSVLLPRDEGNVLDELVHASQESISWLMRRAAALAGYYQPLGHIPSDLIVAGFDNFDEDER